MKRPAFLALCAATMLAVPTVPVAPALAQTTRPAASQKQQQSLSYVDLVRRMADLEHLAVLPIPGEATKQFASYDLRSDYDAENDRFEHWGANGDGHGNVRELEDGQVVLAEIDGPGVIWRTWSAAPGDGHVRFYLDGSDTPAIDLPFKTLFDRTQAPFNHPALAYTTDARGANLYLPISFAKSCKVVAEKDWGRYYQFTYSTFPEGTEVPTFKLDLSLEEVEAVWRVGEALSAGLGEPFDAERDGSKTLDKQVSVKPGQTATVAEIDGEWAITGVRVKLGEFANDADRERAMREMMLQITWDGDDEPAVRVPLGDFFGSPLGGSQPYRSLPVGALGGGEFYSNWFMPFAESAKIELSNDGEFAREVSFEIDHAPLTRPADDYGRFHANYTRGERPERADRWPDWTFLKAQGRGKFAGLFLHVWNGTGGHNRKFGLEGGHWWGEGDEKFFVDGETMPSTFGTGTEDYFGYAWCNPNFFQQAFHGQPLTQNNNGHQGVFRWQVADAIPFQTSFEGAMEKYFNDAWPTRYAGTVFYYLAPGGSDALATRPTLRDRVGYFALSPAYEGENLTVKNATGGKAEPQTLMIDPGTGLGIWSGGSQLWWTGANVGDKLTLGVPVVDEGKYRVYVGMTKANDYATASVGFEGKTPLAPIDFYNKEVWPAQIYLGTYDLDRGEAELTLEITGANRRAGKSHYLGVDYVRLVPADAEEGEPVNPYQQAAATGM